MSIRPRWVAKVIIARSYRSVVTIKLSNDRDGLSVGSLEWLGTGPQMKSAPTVDLGKTSKSRSRQSIRSFFLKSLFRQQSLATLLRIEQPFFPRQLGRVVLGISIPASRRPSRPLLVLPFIQAICSTEPSFREFAVLVPNAAFHWF